MAMTGPPPDPQKIVFWLGCHVLRHGDLVHSCVRLLEALDIDVRTVGGPRYCCGTIKDMNIDAAEALGKSSIGRFHETGRDTLVSYCPSCQSHLDNFMSETNETDFGFGHFVPFLHQRRDRLAKILTKPVTRRVALHLHSGFQAKAAINEMTRDLLALVPGLTVVPHDVILPGAHCTTAFVAVPGVAADIGRSLDRLRSEHQVSDVVTIYHSCQRQLCTYEAAHAVGIVNFVKLLGESAGIEIEEDTYKTWKTAGDETAIRDEIGAAPIEKIGENRFGRLILPELLK